MINMRVEPKTFFANERTFLHWLHMAVTVGSIGGALLGFSGIDGTGAVGGEVIATKIIGLILVGIGCVFTLYAARMFWVRSHRISAREAGPYDDRLGPYLISGVLVVALVSILVVYAVEDARA